MLESTKFAQLPLYGRISSSHCQPLRKFHKCHEYSYAKRRTNVVFSEKPHQNTRRTPEDLIHSHLHEFMWRSWNPLGVYETFERVVTLGSEHSPQVSFIKSSRGNDLLVVMAIYSIKKRHGLGLLIGVVLSTKSRIVYVDVRRIEENSFHRRMNTGMVPILTKLMLVECSIK
ncbi:hypothetical protein RF11_05892 [Thelohanellus kitauei]|uniref:Uncharacterized protein n=1 Tax=Thelohanellus kitauei TaxID=669202 RepID=A0A0C2N548_THEKT|nr:hypothetical protein RF11_05892 [Thelohanellus kitauei]